jgi:putative tryptophan/tyrosine transport system substrate-binding protein
LIPERTVHTRRQALRVLPALALASSGADSQPKLKVIGVLSPYPIQTYRPFREVFLRAMAGLGYVEGKRFVMVERFAEGDNGRLPQMATELVHLDVDVILASSTDAAKAAQQATAVIPIVFEGVADPVMAGFAQSVARPGRNMTGLSNFNADLNPKRFQLLKQMVPGLSTIAVLANPKNPYYATQLQRMRPPAEQLGLKVFQVAAGRTDDLEVAFEEMKQRHAEAFFVVADAYLWLQGRQINGLALKYNLPSISAFEDWVDAGGLMSYGVNPAASMEHVATFVDRIFKGLRPEEIPIEQPTTLVLVVNRRTAKLLGITIPQAISLQADRVVG